MVLDQSVPLAVKHPPEAVVVVDHTTAMVHSEESEAAAVVAAAAVVPHQDCSEVVEEHHQDQMRMVPTNYPHLVGCHCRLVHCHHQVVEYCHYQAGRNWEDHQVLHLPIQSLKYHPSLESLYPKDHHCVPSQTVLQSVPACS